MYVVVELNEKHVFKESILISASGNTQSKHENLLQEIAIGLNRFPETKLLKLVII